MTFSDIHCVSGYSPETQIKTIANDSKENKTKLMLAKWNNWKCSFNLSDLRQLFDQLHNALAKQFQ